MSRDCNVAGAENDLQLRDGARIAVVGAGPAGSLFAIFAWRLAAELGRKVHITVFDGKPFTQSGPQGCNMCAGVVAEGLVARFREIGLTLPESIVQRHIRGYWWETRAGNLHLSPQKAESEIYTVYRGNGPRGSTPGRNVSFDDYLLGQVSSLGVQVVPQPVVEIQVPHGTRNDPATVLVGSKAHKEVYEADLVVGAFGLSPRLARQVTALGFGYVPPPTLPSYQAELRLGADRVKEGFQDRIVIYELGLSGIKFGAIIPKQEHLTVTLIGEKAGKESLLGFLAHPLVSKRLPPGWQAPADYCHCCPRVAVAPCQKPFTNRIVMIGDASVSRLYKNGLDSAFLTAKAAAEAAFRHGVSAQAFARYYLPTCRALARDSAYGRLLFRLSALGFASQIFLRLFVQAARYEQLACRPREQVLGRILWGSFTGDQPYKDIVLAALSLRIQWRLWSSLLVKKASPIPGGSAGDSIDKVTPDEA
ncbi:MAG: hypothetical protein HY783_08580 [Chloroflexi bacterium]|nr:hypothetical protein [Chloroflexota bacterium]